MKTDFQDALLGMGVILLAAGVAAIYWPAALILLGLLALAAVVLIERTRKPNGPAHK